MKARDQSIHTARHGPTHAAQRRTVRPVSPADAVRPLLPHDLHVRAEKSTGSDPGLARHTKELERIQSELLGYTAEEFDAWCTHQFWAEGVMTWRSATEHHRYVMTYRRIYVIT
jgi:hypothetical protein